MQIRKRCIWKLYAICWSIPYHSRCYDSAVGLVTGYGLDDEGVGVRVPAEERILTPFPPGRFWGPPSLLWNGYRGLFPRGKAAGA
jgi:hypothetical protein